MNRLILLLIIPILGGCFGGAPDILRTAKPAVETQYIHYLNDKKDAQKVDTEWLEGNKSLEANGFKGTPHPYGDQSLLEWNIEKIRDHKYSKY